MRWFFNVSEKPEHVTADSPKGVLVRENPIQMMTSAVIDTGKDVVNLGRALSKGEATDTQLGRMNDLGMKIGGGLIAGALMGSKASTNQKMMEVFESFGFNHQYSIDGINICPSTYVLDGATKADLGWSAIGQYKDLVNPYFFQLRHYLFHNDSQI